MITRTSSVDHIPGWQRDLADSITSVSELLDILELDSLQVPFCQASMQQFPLRVTRSYVDRMRRGATDDPLLLQVLPAIAESIHIPGYSPDPLQESAAMPAPGVIRKYHGRVLLTVTGACGIHCRYCFRRHFPYSDANPARDNWHAAIQHIRLDPSLSEVILSGGDPLVLNDVRLGRLCAQLEDIPHIARLRIHTRLPVVLPQRIDERLIAWIDATRLQCVMVMHVNHPNEIDATFTTACTRLRTAGVTLLNQSVLLKGVNDDPGTLARLSEALFTADVLPYYLHQLDRVQGAAHFEVDRQDARVIMDTLHAVLPGYLVPRFVEEIPGAIGKVDAWRPQDNATAEGLPETATGSVTSF